MSPTRLARRERGDRNALDVEAQNPPLPFNPNHVPEDLWIKIFMYLNVSCHDVRALGDPELATCELKFAPHANVMEGFDRKLSFR